ncbi:MAG TPA: ferritin-like domain-containing protein [Mycobacteriales bacterium]|nr:ferritin-like domain-containing protein [Mycobacteriales bacterium]
MTGAEALARAVAAEQQVIYGYGVAGAHLTGPQLGAALAALDVHRIRRDTLMQLLSAAGGRAPVEAPAYALPFAVTTPSTARALCALLEDGCAGAAWDLTAATAAHSPTRSLAVTWLGDSAVRAAQWRGRGAALPALPGRP